MNKETDIRIRKKIFAKLLDDICKAHSYCIFTKCIYDPVNFKSYYTIKVMNRLRFKTAEIPGIFSGHTSDDAYAATTACGNIYYAIDEWDYIRTLYTCALSCQDEAVINNIESVFSSFGIEIRTDDILADINDLIERYTSPKHADGELVAWLLEFKKNRFGFRNEEELL